MASGLASAARARPSARIRRPSASVLVTSMVMPLRAVTTSPGRRAAAPGLFSTRGTMAWAGGGPDPTRDGRRPGHVVLHAVHAGAALEVEAAGVEGDPLADQGHVPAGPRASGPRRC